MNIHGIEKDSMLNGDGLRCVLWVSGCEHHCPGCHNPQTHDLESGYPMTTDHLVSIVEYLKNDYVSGVTLSGGDSLHPANRYEITLIARSIKTRFPDKTIWCYTGYKWEAVKDLPVMQYIDVLCDGRFVQELADVKCKWVGSKNQRVIDVQRSLKEERVVLHD